VSWGRDEIDQVPQPWLIGSRAQLEQLGIQPVQLVPQPIGTATELFEQRFLRSTQLPSQQELRFIQLEPTKTGLIGTQ
jgi:hypothetical protein